MRRFRGIISGGVVVGLLIMLAVVFSGAASGGDEAKGEKAADFTLKDLNGDEVSLSDYEGKVVLLNFWATWCPPCRAEIPHFVELVEELGNEGLVVLGISADRGGPDVVRKWLANNPVNYPMVMSSPEVYTTYQNYLSPGERGGIPFTFVIDRKGMIRQRLVGYRDKATWEGILKPLLAEK